MIRLDGVSTADKVIGGAVAGVVGALVVVAGTEAGSGAAAAIAVAAVGLPGTVAGVVWAARRADRDDVDSAGSAEGGVR